MDKDAPPLSGCKKRAAFCSAKKAENLSLGRGSVKHVSIALSPARAAGGNDPPVGCVRVSKEFATRRFQEGPWPGSLAAKAQNLRKPQKTGANLLTADAAVC
jgi:hypothetical protein